MGRGHVVTMHIGLEINFSPSPIACHVFSSLAKTIENFSSILNSNYYFLLPKSLPQDATDVEAGVATRVLRKRKTSQNDQSYGSFFLRIGAIGKRIKKFILRVLLLSKLKKTIFKFKKNYFIYNYNFFHTLLTMF